MDETLNSTTNTDVLIEVREILKIMRDKDDNVEKALKALQKQPSFASWIAPTLRGVIGSLIITFVLGAVLFAKMPYTNAREIDELYKLDQTNIIYVDDQIDNLRHNVNIELSRIDGNFKSITPQLEEDTYLMNIREIHNE